MSMFKKKSRIWVMAALSVAACASAASAVIYTWDAAPGVGGDWTDCDNWARTGGAYTDPCYPNNSNHDVVFPSDTTGWGVVVLDFDSLTIDDMIVAGDVTFQDDGQGPLATLTCDTLTIDAATYAPDNGVDLIVDGGTIIAN